MIRAIVAVLASLTAACGGSSSPTGPSGGGPATPTRIVDVLGGPLAFNDVKVGEFKDLSFRIRNNGTSVLTVTSLSISSVPSVFASSFTSGTIAAGTEQTVSLRFRPTLRRSYDGQLTVNGDQTAGNASTAVFASGVADTFTKAGTGNTVFDLPSWVERVRVTGTVSGCQNFIVRRNGPSFINTIIGTCSVADAPAYDGTHLMTGGGGTIEIVSSEGVAWTFTEVR